MADDRVGPLQELRILRAAACDPRLARGDIAVFTVVMAHMGRSGDAWPGKETIARAASLNPRNVLVCITKLEAQGWLIVERRGQRFVNHYRLGATAMAARSGDVHNTRQPAQSGVASITSANPSGDADITSSGDVGITDLVMPASPELTCNSQKRNSKSESRARDWAPSSDGIAFFERECAGSAEVVGEVEWEKFRDWHIARGKGFETDEAMDAAWRGWVRKIDQFSGNGAGPGPSKSLQGLQALEALKSRPSLADQVRDPFSHAARPGGHGRRLSVAERVEANIRRAQARDALAGAVLDGDFAPVPRGRGAEATSPSPSKHRDIEEDQT